MKKLLAFIPAPAVLIGAVAAVAMFAAAPVAQAAPKFDLVSGSGTWNGGLGTPTLHVKASNHHGAHGNPQFTINYAAPLETTIQGPITKWSVAGNSNEGDASACVTGLVDKSDDGRFVVGQYVPITIAKIGGVWMFNFGPSQPEEPALCKEAANLVFDSAEFTIFDAP